MITADFFDDARGAVRNNTRVNPKASKSLSVTSKSSSVGSYHRKCGNFKPLSISLYLYLYLKIVFTSGDLTLNAKQSPFGPEYAQLMNAVLKIPSMSVINNVSVFSTYGQGTQLWGISVCTY